LMKLDFKPWVLLGFIVLFTMGLSACDGTESISLLDAAIPLPPSVTPQTPSVIPQFVQDAVTASPTVNIVSPTPSKTPDYTATPTDTVTASITARPSATLTVTVSLTSSLTVTLLFPTWTYTPTPSSTATRARTVAVGFTWTPAPPISATPGWTRSYTPSRSPTTAFSPTATRTRTATPSWTYTFTPSPTSTTIPTLTGTSISATPSSSPVSSPSFTPTLSPTWTPTFTKTDTPLPPTSTPTKSPVPPSPTATGCSLVYNHSFETTVILLINNYRVKAGLAKLNENASLDSSALTHSIDMAENDFLSHTGSDGSSYWDRELKAGYTGQWGGEIIYAGSGAYNSPNQAVTWWMNDPPHKAIILADYNDLGAGYAYCPTGTYGGFFTADFGHR